jgi:predicted homoserine dehydrogenase-like protein
VTVGLIGAGKFGTMFLAQARLTRGLHVVAVADLDVARARGQLRTAGWEEERISAASLGEAFKTGRTHVTPDAAALIAFPDVEVIVEATGVPPAGIRHALSAIAHGKHIVMVNVEADAVAGLARAQGQGGGRGLQPAWGDSPC